MPKSQLYLQTRERILELIRRQELVPGSQLPSEMDLSTTLGVSRNTIREALMSLERDGTVIRRHGLGTFLSTPPQPLKTTLNRMFPIPELIAAAGFSPHMQDIEIRTCQGPAEVCQILSVPPTTLLPFATLLYLADRRPAILIDYWLIPVFAGDARWEQFDGHMVNFVEQTLKMPLHHSYARIHAVVATRDLATKLKVKPGSPLLQFTHTAFTADDRPVYTSVSYQDSDLLQVTVMRQRK